MSTRPTTLAASRRRPPPDAPTGATTDTPAGTAPPLRYLGALDGIRALAVVAVFAFHAGYPWASGGFLGVSVFFTLSGFLITRLLLDEGVAQRSVDLLRFWARRLRRLLPAALTTIVFVLVLTRLGLAVDGDRLRDDVLAALGYVANWRFLASDQSYLELFRTPSPLLHFWSLAIEEQFYLLFPIATWLAVRRGDPVRMRTRLRTGLLVGIAASVVVTLLAARGDGVDFVYYSLPTRAAELLVGAALATSVWVARLQDRRAPAWLTGLGVAALGAIGWLAATTNGIGGWVGNGGLPAFALLSGALIVAALGRGPIATVLALAPLRGLGKISYGVYLYHWPIILWLTPQRVGVDGSGLVAVWALATLATATVSYFVIERPIRRGGVLRGHPARVAAPVGIAIVAVLGLVIAPLSKPSPAIDLEAAARELERLNEAAPPPPPTAPGNEVPGVATVPRVAFLGDSSGLMTATGMTAWAQSTGELVVAGGAAWYGCGLVRDGTARFAGEVIELDGCGSIPDQWGRVLDESRPEAVVIQVGPIEVDDHRLPGDSEWRALGDPVFDDYLEAKLLEAVDVVLSRGIVPIWLTSPTIQPSRSTIPPNDDPSNDPRRMARFNQILRSVAVQRPGLQIIDLAGWVRRWPGGPFDPALRPDGVHFDRAMVATELAPWLGPRIAAASRPESATPGSPATVPAPG